VDPNDVTIDFPGQPPRHIPPLGRVGRIANEPRPNADYYDILRGWRRARLPDLTIVRALFGIGLDNIHSAQFHLLSYATSFAIQTFADTIYIVSSLPPGMTTAPCQETWPPWKPYLPA
jgi:hypothetical protein